MSLAYHLIKTYNASNFLNEFAYYSQADPTNGDVNYLDRDTAISSGLSFINNLGNVVLKVDDHAVPVGKKRDSVRISSTDSFGFGTLWVLDALHTPYGCSVWGAYWSIGAGVPWPTGGEIDIFEGVNMQSANQMVLHTGPQCTMPSGLSQTGTAQGTDCNSFAGHNSGCGVMDANTKSYGKAFADSGGGVWVTQFEASGIKIWFVPRSAVPQGGVPPDPSKLGTPSAFYPASECDIASLFVSQALIFDITLCGDWAGNAMGGACPVQSGQTCYSTYVVGNGHNFAEAYFEIASLKIYAVGDPQPTPTSTSSPSSSPTPSCLSTYTSVAGDTCATLENKNNLVSGTIKQANQFLDCNNIWPWTPICIPNGPYNAPVCGSTYRSVAGDTCSSIETKYNLVEGTIKTANSFLTCTDIWTFTPICIPNGPYKQFACKTTYRSIAGDTCATIDNEFNLIDGITKAANSFLTCSDIWTATPVCIPNGPYKTSYEPKCVTQAYESLAGETCSSIEAKFALAAGSVSSANTWVNCADIWTKTRLSICVPTLSNNDPQTCTNTIISTAGNTCTSIAQGHGTSASWIKAWNPFLNCVDIWTGTQVCVSHT